MLPSIAAVARSARSAALLVCLIGVASACSGSASSRSATAKATASASPVTPLSPAQIAARATPAVVSIRSPDSLGTGFVIRKDGWIATNLHVIAGAEDLIVATRDKREYPVIEVLGMDEARDLAILRIDAKGLS